MIEPVALRDCSRVQASFDERQKGRLNRRSDYHQLVLDMLLLVAYLVAMPIIVASSAYGFMWGVLCLVRFIPMIGRKHRHSDWDRLNK
jgi:hypothetical protein